MGRPQIMNILILGIGNILFQDEGIGAHFIHYLDEKYEFISQENSDVIVTGKLFPSHDREFDLAPNVTTVCPNCGHKYIWDSINKKFIY